MNKLLQINTVCNTGSTGRIVEQLGIIAMEQGWESHVAFGRGTIRSASQVYKIGNTFTKYFNAICCRLFDNDGFNEIYYTNKLIKHIKKINPTVIHLHNLHGYYLNIEILFKYLTRSKIPIIWTFHDCWPITGHCTHFDYLGCNKWKTTCYKCPQINEYPRSLFLDNSNSNHVRKKNIFSELNTLYIVSPSKWLSNLINQSFLNSFNIKVINNGIDVNEFKPFHDYKLYEKYNIPKDKKIVLGVASVWNIKKGLDYFKQLSDLLPTQFQIILVGLNQTQIRNLPFSIIGISRTNNIRELVSLYTIADVFVNPTLEDNFPTTNLEAMSCGTPVVTFETGGSIESIKPETGIIVSKGDILSLSSKIQEVVIQGKTKYYKSCREHIIENFSSTEKFKEYLKLYNSLC